MACNWLMMTSSAEHHPRRFGYSHRQNYKKNYNNNKPKAEQETAQPTAAWSNKPKAEQETAQPTAARFSKKFKKKLKTAIFFLTLLRSQKYYVILSNNILRETITRKKFKRWLVLVFISQTTLGHLVMRTQSKY